MITFCLVYVWISWDLPDHITIVYFVCSVQPCFPKSKAYMKPSDASYFTKSNHIYTIYSTIQISVYLYEVKAHKNVAMCIISLLLFSSCSYGWRHTGIKTMANILWFSLHCLVNTTWVHRMAIIFMIYFIFQMRESLTRERCNGLHIILFFYCEWLVHYI